jgi:hypothetical protein
MKPKQMTCTCCGRYYRGRQWWNQDKGHGLGDCCVDFCKKGHTDESFTQTYGFKGVHYLIEEGKHEKPKIRQHI